MSNEQDNTRGFGMPPLGIMEPQEEIRRPRGRPPLSQSEDSSEEEAKIELLRADAENCDATVEISRRIGNKFGWCASIPLPDWSSSETKQHIAQQFGGGDYRVRVRRSDRSQAMQFTFTIDHSIKPAGLLPAEKDTANNIQHDNTVMQLMQSSSDSQMRFMQMLNAQQAESAKQQAESSRQMMTIMAGMLQRQTVPAAPALNDRLMEILLSRAMAPTPAPVNDMSKIISALAEIRRDDSPAEEKDDIFTSVIKALPAFMPMLTNMMQPKPQVIQAQVKNNQSPVNEPINVTNNDIITPQVEEVPPLTPAVEASNINKSVLAAFLPQIVGLCEQGIKPVDASVSIIESLGGQIGELKILLQRTDWLALLIDAHSPIMKHTRWFTELRNDLITK